jgi:ECF sigma factor
VDEPSVSQHRVTQLLEQWSHGDDAALAELTPLVYDELRRLAHRHMEGERPDHTLQTTALINEAYLRLADQTTSSCFRRERRGAIAS